MSDLPQAGVRLVAADENAFKAALAAANGAVQVLGVTSGSTAQQIDKLTSRIDFQKRALDIMQQELAQTSAKYGEGSVQAQRKQLAVDKLTASIARDEKALEQLQQQEAATAGSSAQLVQGFDRAGQASTRLGQVMTGALRRAGELVVNAFVRIGQAALAGIGQAVGAAGDYEQAMNVMQAQSGATDAQMQRVKDTAKALGADLTLPATSAVDAGKAMLELSKGGLDVEQSMTAAKGTLQLAAAAETDVATAANITTGALAAFGLSGEQAAFVADLLTNAANKSRASINDVSLGFQQAAFRFHSAGQGADDLAASLTVLIQAGLGGSDAGTALQNAIARLQGPTDKAAGLMKELGINVYDAQGNMLPMQSIIGVLNKAFAGMSQQQRNAALQTIFLSDGMKAMIPLLDAGAEGFAKTKGEMNEQGAAAKMAEAQMKGLKGATEGLQSQLETLALEGLEPLLPLMAGGISKAAAFAGSFVGQVGPAVKDTIVLFTEIAGVIRVGVVPALEALAAATAIYALINLPAMIAAIGTATAAIAAQGAAMLLAAGPFVVIAGAIAMVMLKYKQLDDQLASVTDKVLAGSKAWQESVQALDAYNAASDETKAFAQAQAEALQGLQDAQREAIKQYALHTAAYEQFGIASGQTAASLEAERLAINARGDAIVQGTAALNDQIATYQHLHDTDAIEDIRMLKGAHEELGQAVQNDAIDYEELEKAIKKATDEGTAAVESYINAAIGFNQQLIDAVRKGNDEQARSVAANYAEQAAAARASLGQQLIDYAIAWARMNGVSEEVLSKTVAQIEKQFGQAGSIAASTFLGIEGDIRDAMANGGSAVDRLAGRLGAATDKAIVMKEKADALRGQYIAEIVDNFDEKTGDINELRHALDQVQRRVDIEIHTNYTESGKPPRHGGQQGDAVGGPIGVGDAHWVGEQGKELFMPSQSGAIIPHDLSMRLTSPPATPAQIAAGGQRGATAINNNQRTYNYSPVYNAPPRAPAVDFASMAALGA